MKLLIDTHLLLWSAARPKLLPEASRVLMEDVENELVFSVVSIWELTIKKGLGRKDYVMEPRVLRRGLLDHGYQELPVTSEHTFALEGLPKLHKDPFDRILIAQALAEGFTLLTVDPWIAQYPGPIRSFER